MFEGREWHNAPPAPAQLLEELRSVAPVELPDSYYRLLSFSDGGEGPLPVNPYNLCLDSSSQVIESLRGQSEPEFVIFGGSGSGEVLAFDLRGEAPWPVVTIDMVAGAQSAELVASNFNQLLELIGMRPINH
jgi:hypothetical protein